MWGPCNLLYGLLNCDSAYFLGSINPVAGTHPRAVPIAGRNVDPITEISATFRLGQFQSPTGIARDRPLCHAEILIGLSQTSVLH